MKKICKNCRHWAEIHQDEIIIELRSKHPDFQDTYIVRKPHEIQGTIRSFIETHELKSTKPSAAKFGICCGAKIVYKHGYSEAEFHSGILNDAGVYLDRNDIGSESDFWVGSDFGCIHFEEANKKKEDPIL